MRTRSTELYHRVCLGVALLLIVALVAWGWGR
jgi:hypothetical protein